LGNMVWEKIKAAKLLGEIVRWHPKMVDALIVCKGSNLFNHHVTSGFWVPGRCDPASFAKTWAHNDSKWTTDKHTTGHASLENVQFFAHETSHTSFVWIGTPFNLRVLKIISAPEALLYILGTFLVNFSTLGLS
jgi:hypothetical protein